MKTAIIVAFACIVLVVTALVALSSTYHPLRSPNRLTSPQSVLNPTTGLEFAVSLNSSSTVQGAITVQMNLRNTLNRPNNVTQAELWHLTNLSEIDNSQSILCADEMGPYRIAVYRGFYDSGNYSNGAPLSVFPWPSQPAGAKGPNWCGAYLRESSWLGSDLPYLFEAQSNIATLHLWNLGSWTTPMNLTVILKPLTYSFSAGQYTVVCGDEWGDITLAHFTV